MKDRYKAQRTAPGPSVGAGGEQSVAELFKSILADEPDPINAVFIKAKKRRPTVCTETFLSF